jgi:hypothetical protein
MHGVQLADAAVLAIASRGFVGAGELLFHRRDVAGVPQGLYALRALWRPSPCLRESLDRPSYEKPKVYPPPSSIIGPRAPVAQWIERRPPEPKVAGSNPVGRARTLVLFLRNDARGARQPDEARRP